MSSTYIGLDTRMLGVADSPRDGVAELLRDRRGEGRAGSRRTSRIGRTLKGMAATTAGGGSGAVGTSIVIIALC